MSTAEQQQLPSLEELKERAIEGHPITTEEVSKIAKTETELTDGRGPIAGGVAATAQSLKAKQEHFLEVASEVSHKPVEEITKEDAAAVESAEVCLFTIISLIDHCQIHHHRCGLILTNLDSYVYRHVFLVTARRRDQLPLRSSRLRTRTRNSCPRLTRLMPRLWWIAVHSEEDCYDDYENRVCAFSHGVMEIEVFGRDYTKSMTYEHTDGTVSAGKTLIDWDHSRLYIRCLQTHISLS